MRFGPNQVALAFVALLALSLVGLPIFVGRPESEAALRGVVVDARGFGIADAAVFLFSEARLQLLEETRSEHDGDFAFHLGTERPRIFVRPRAESGLLPAWGPPGEESAGTQAFVLRPARRLAVSVRDLAGGAVSGAEVRVYEQRGEPAVIGLAKTDLEGHAELLAPAQADVAVFAPDSGLTRWRFDYAVPEQGAELRFTLPPATLVHGQVLGEGTPLAGILLVAWEEGLDGGWNGFTTSDAEGRFALPLTAAPSEGRAFDPSAVHLSVRTRLGPALDTARTLSLPRASPLVVRLARNGIPLGARVWSWSPANETWSIGVRTNASGRATVPAAGRFGVRAEPLDPAYAALQAWDVPYEEGTLLLEASPRR